MVSRPKPEHANDQPQRLRAESDAHRGRGDRGPSASGARRTPTCRSKLMPSLRGNSEVLERLTVEMYARSLSTRRRCGPSRMAGKRASLTCAVQQCIANASGPRICWNAVSWRSGGEPVIPPFFTEKSCIKLVYATLWRVSQRWQGVKMSELVRPTQPGGEPCGWVGWSVP
jgi:hypothetical protein